MGVIPTHLRHVLGLTSCINTASAMGILCRRLDELFERFVFDICCGPFWYLISWKVTSEFHFQAAENDRTMINGVG